MSEPIDIRVRKGKGRSHRMSIALDNLKAAGGPVSLRVVVEANLPRRSKGRRQAREYQRITSYMVDCRAQEAVRFTRNTIDELMRFLDCLRPGDTLRVSRIHANLTPLMQEPK